MPLDTFEREFARTQGFPPCSTVQYMDLKTYLPYDILTKVDVASMMHGLEVRTPLVDIRVVEFAATIPESVSISKEYTRKREGKLLLKRAMEKYYPSDFLRRPKMGFAVPISKWFAPNGALRDALHDRLLGADSPLREFFEPETMASLVERNVTGALWLLLFLAEWLRQNRSSISL
jgi:asparagine synthase (glutamine-hydrolysing)